MTAQTEKNKKNPNFLFLNIFQLVRRMAYAIMLQQAKVTNQQLVKQKLPVIKFLILLLIRQKRSKS